MQIQDAFGGLALADLCLLGLKIYLRAPDFKAACPLCGGAGCAVRHGLYYRQVVDREGVVIERFPIPRFRCRRRGRRRSGAATFSVLPSALVPRRRFSLPLMLLILDLVHRCRSIPKVLDYLAEVDRGLRGALLVEEVAIYRVLDLFASYPYPRCWMSTAVDRGLCSSLRKTPPQEVILMADTPRETLLKRPGRYARRLPVPELSGRRIRYLKVETIAWIEAVSQYVRLHTGDKSFLVRSPAMTVRHLASRLDPEQFVRVSRSHIVNLEWVDALRMDAPAKQYAVLVGGFEVPVSRAHWERLKEALVGCDWE